MPPDVIHTTDPYSNHDYTHTRILRTEKAPLNPLPFDLNGFTITYNRNKTVFRPQRKEIFR
jgi:hypothetical protein